MLNIALIFIYLIFGYILQKTRFGTQPTANYLNKFVIYISLPAMILLQIPNISISLDSVIPVGIAWSVMTLTAIIVFIVAKIFHFSKEITGALLLVTPLGNTSFLGIPLIQTYLSPSALPYVIIYDQLGTFLALAVYGTIIISLYSNTSELNLKMILYKVLTFPPFVFLMIAFMIPDTSYIDGFKDIFEILAFTITPFALIAVGLQLNLLLPKQEIKYISFSLFIKLIISPLLAYLICFYFGWNTLSSTVSIMEAGMAPMITAGAMASLAGLAPRLTSAILGFGIVISFVTIYILSFILL